MLGQSFLKFRVMGRSWNKTLQVLFFFLILCSCGTKNKNISAKDLQAISLKKGALVLCGSSESQLGSVKFEISCDDKLKKEFNLAMELLHSFEYEEAEKQFAKIIEADPQCAMAYWGVAMSNYHPLWTPPTAAELKKGKQVLDLARSIPNIPERESAYIRAIAMIYDDADKSDLHTRSVQFMEAMDSMYRKYPDDKEAAILFALSLDAAADPADKSYANQKKAGEILNAVYPGEPNHPGIIHYIIHTYDYPGLAELALPAARKYAMVAPASSHALHMPSHIFTRLGLWDESVRSNLASTAAATCYAENTSIKGHWDEELHGLDYLEYAYLQKADDSLAKKVRDYLSTIETVYPMDFKVAYAFAAIPARYTLERKDWSGAADLAVRPQYFPWNSYPWQEAIIHFARLLGMVHLNRMDSATMQLVILKKLRDTLMLQMDKYKVNQVNIQIQTAEAWMLFYAGKKQQALAQMQMAADKEDATEKHPVTPGEVIPARELLGDMLLLMGRNSEALTAYQANLKIRPNRFNALYGAGRAAEKSGNREEARKYYRVLSDQSAIHSNRPELISARLFLRDT